MNLVICSLFDSYQFLTMHLAQNNFEYKFYESIILRKISKIYPSPWPDYVYRYDNYQLTLNFLTSIKIDII